MNRAAETVDLPGKKNEKVKELEEKIKKLETENKKLLLHKEDVRRPHQNGGIHALLDSDDELENGLLDIKLLLNENIFKEDEWLYVSPKLPPTPVHKKVTPRQWLSEGHSRAEVIHENLPSLDDVRKSLIFNIDEAENLSNYTSLPDHKRKPAATDKSHGHSQAPSHGKANLPSKEDAIPVVKWKAKLPAESPAEAVENDQLPLIKWKVEQVPSSGRSAVLSAEDEERIADQHDVREGSVDNVPPVDDDASPPMVKWKAKMPNSDDVPVVKWKAKMPEEIQGSDDVPVVKWKAKVPVETQGSDVPVARRKARMPVKIQGSDDVPVVKWKAKVPLETQGSDVPVARRKAKMPVEIQGSDVPVVRRKAKMPEEIQGSDDVPVVKWKAKMPEEIQGSDVPVVRRTVKIPEENQGSDNVPVVNWKAKMPVETQGSDVPVVRRKARMPEENQGSDNVPVVNWKAKMPVETQGSDVPVSWRKAKLPEDPQVFVGKLKAKMPQEVQTSVVKRDQNTDVPVAPTGNDPNPQRHRKIAKMPVDDNSSSESTPSHSSSHLPSSPPHSPVISPSHTPRKSLSRRSSFTESRSPSPPSISPHVRRAIASPILSRRTPSPSRGLVGSLNARVSPNASPVLQQKHLQYISGSQQSPGLGTGTSSSRSFTSAISSSGSPSHMSRLRTPHSQSTGKVKTSSPMKGLTPPGERKHKRTLPTGPPDVIGGQANRSNQRTPSSNKKLSPGQDINEDDDSWLEGCY